MISGYCSLQTLYMNVALTQTLGREIGVSVLSLTLFSRVVSSFKQERMTASRQKWGELCLVPMGRS